MPHRNYSSTASRTTISATISPSDTTLSVASLTGYPAPPFTAAIDRGNASEELVTVTAVAGNSVTITRGVDGSAAKTHSAQAAFEHVTSARDFKDATSVTSTDGQAYDSARLGGMSAPLYLLTSDANAAYAAKAGKGAAVYQTTAQPVGASTSLVLSFNAGDFDDGFRNASFLTRLTAPSAGLYDVQGACALAGLADGKRVQIQILRNGAVVGGTTRDATQSGTAGTATAATGRAMRLAAADYLELIVFQDDAVARNTDVNRTSFSIVRIGD